MPQNNEVYHSFYWEHYLIPIIIFSFWLFIRSFRCYLVEEKRGLNKRDFIYGLSPEGDPSSCTLSIRYVFIIIILTVFYLLFYSKSANLCFQWSGGGGGVAD